MPLGLAALDDLFDAFEGLREVLGGNDAVAIETASQRVSTAAAAVRAIGAWRSDPAVVERLSTLLPLLESARVRVNLLADHTSQRLSILASHGVQAAPLTYGR
ncbi:hypothetical protein MOK15_15885 [Sphingobium sp. BYY-5]|uniref:hypothetical protein n=1 Tax=Sphingobium sp. BYY-5 TaxID=2926400 RepID=UPI001FA70888|nr:hypothetical protein [Sphingobium sp. BYY-5]MCI4591564.1 hypothetical protein [Sphingobium sp. BYY-5]